MVSAQVELSFLLMEATKQFMETRFPSSAVEPRWLNEWRLKGLSSPEKTIKNPSKKDPFVVVLPPPNITGNLHLGHALDSVLPDCLLRYHLANNRTCLWVPGT